jgi:hypothetical protein
MKTIIIQFLMGQAQIYYVIHYKINSVYKQKVL